MDTDLLMRESNLTTNAFTEEDFKPTMMDTITTGMGNALRNGPTGGLYRTFKNFEFGDEDKNGTNVTDAAALADDGSLDITDNLPDITYTKKMSVEDQKAEIERRGLTTMKTDPKYTPQMFASVAESKASDEKAAWYREHNGDAMTKVLGFVGEFGAGFLDPINIAASVLVPGMPAATASRFIQGAESAGGAALRRAGVGAVGGGVGAAVLEPAMYMFDTQEQRDHDAGTALSNIAMGIGMGAALHPAIGAWHDFRAHKLHKHAEWEIEAPDKVSENLRRGMRSEILTAAKDAKAKGIGFDEAEAASIIHDSRARTWAWDHRAEGKTAADFYTEYPLQFRGMEYFDKAPDGTLFQKDPFRDQDITYAQQEENWELADYMRGQGHFAQRTRDATGMYVDENGNWGEASIPGKVNYDALQPGTQTTLGAVFDAGDLYTRYPGLSDIRVKVAMDSSNRAVFERNGEFIVNKRVLDAYNLEKPGQWRREQWGKQQPRNTFAKPETAPKFSTKSWIKDELVLEIRKVIKARQKLDAPKLPPQPEPPIPVRNRQLYQLRTMENIEIADGMLNDGIDPATVRDVTGMTRNPDGSWTRYSMTGKVNVDVLRSGKSVALEKVFAAEALYAKYPALRNIRVRFNNETMDRAAVMDSKGHILVNKDILGDNPDFYAFAWLKDDVVYEIRKALREIFLGDKNPVRKNKPRKKNKFKPEKETPPEREPVIYDHPEKPVIYDHPEKPVIYDYPRKPVIYDHPEFPTVYDHPPKPTYPPTTYYVPKGPIHDQPSLPEGPYPHRKYGPPEQNANNYPAVYGEQQLTLQYDPAVPVQPNRGMFNLMEDGKALITIFKNADATTIPHELAHFFRQVLGHEVLMEHCPKSVQTYYQDMLDFVGAKPGEKWTADQEEMFANAFERYMSEGVAPVSQLDSLFAYAKQQWAEIYSQADLARLEISPAMRKAFGRMLQLSPEEGNVAWEYALGKFMQDKHDSYAPLTEDDVNTNTTPEQDSKTLDGDTEIAKARFEEETTVLESVDPQVAEAMRKNVETGEQDISAQRTRVENERSAMQDLALCELGGME